ncbi:MAG: F0F1 ATP synthase subunit gamma [Deltaproteobacteria bacterium]|nr:F0F1 ATP synthase subunit gamma [Deltaproteobacteria bacterium]
MPTLENLKAQICTIDLLQSVVRTMKTLAAVSIRQQEKAIQTLSDYSRTIDMGLAILLNQGDGEIVEQLAVSDGKLGAVIIGSDQGLCGRFNEQVVSFALETLRDLEAEESRRTIFCIGRRAHMHLTESGAMVDGAISAPVSVTGIIPVVNSVLITIEQWHAHRGIERVVICSNRLFAGTTCRPEILHLLPFDRERLRELASRPWPGKTLPQYSMDRNRLFSLLVRQSLFASLYRILAESMAGENASRLASMQAAEKNIGERLDELNLRFRDLRQGAITEELLDIVAGFEAMTSEG